VIKAPRRASVDTSKKMDGKAAMHAAHCRQFDHLQLSPWEAKSAQLDPDEIENIIARGPEDVGYGAKKDGRRWRFTIPPATYQRPREIQMTTLAEICFTIALILGAAILVGI
jgi:hypothetical protein